MKRQHTYNTSLRWTGNKGIGTSHYKAFERSYTVSINNETDILGSSDLALLGNRTKHNPEELLVASLSSCHMLWYLHPCAEAGIVVTSYLDNAVGAMTELINGSGKFTAVTLNPAVTVSELSMIEKANALHQKANEYCFIANSVNFKIAHWPTCTSE